MIPPVFDRLKIPVLTVFISLLIFFVMIKLFGPIPFTINSINTEKTEQFTADGTGEATSKPDTAKFIVGITKTGPSVGEAQNQTNAAVNAIVEGLKKQGIQDKDIKTDEYSVNPNIDFTSGTQKTNGYTVSTNITVKIKEADKANRAIDTATKNGANIISGISFTINDEEREKLEDKARADAIRDAKEKAKRISQQAGIHLGKITNIIVSPTSPGPILYNKAMSAPDESTPQIPTQLQPGENTVTISVTLYYETL